MGERMVFHDMDIRVHTLWVSAMGASRFDAYQRHSGEQLTEIISCLICTDGPRVSGVRIQFFIES